MDAKVENTEPLINEEALEEEVVKGLDEEGLGYFVEGTPQSATKALDIAMSYGGIDGGHHKQWCIDQMVRALTGDKYDEFITYYSNGEDGPETYSWDEGIAP